MEILSDVSASSALVWATIEAEKAFGGVSYQKDWQSKVENIIIPPFSMTVRDIEGGKDDFLQRRKKQQPLKTIPPPSACNLDNAFLADRITSLQKRALLGRWHFPDMGDSQMHLWLGKQWNHLLGYIPKFVRLMKD